MSHNKNFSRQTLRLISNFRGIPEVFADRDAYKQPLQVGVVLTSTLRMKFKVTSTVAGLDRLRQNWKAWFSGTDFMACYPERLDKWNCLWMKVPNQILSQKLRLKTETFLNTVRKLTQLKIDSVRWFT